MFKDLRHAVRILLRAKGWTAVVILSLALGIGANTALFIALNGLFLRQLPVIDPDTLVRLRHAGRNDMLNSSSDHGFTRKDAGRDVRTTFSSATELLVVVSAIAGYLPARRAARVDPLVALHYE